jgi:hypothetical protein
LQGNGEDPSLIDRTHGGLLASRAQVEERELPESRDDLAPTPVWDASERLKEHLLADLVGFPFAADRGEVRRAPIEDPLVWAEGEDA